MKFNYNIKKPLITISITLVRNSASPTKYEIRKDDSFEGDWNIIYIISTLNMQNVKYDKYKIDI